MGMPEWKQRLKRRLSLVRIRHSRFFDEKWYREQAGLPAGTDAAAYYLDGGWRTTDPSPAFRQEGYLEANEDVRRADVCPLAHYLLDGLRQGRLLYPGYVANRYYRHAAGRAALRTASEILHRGTIRRNREIRLLAVVHLYYPEACGEIFEYLNNLRPYRCELAVTIPEGRQAEVIRQAVLGFRPDADVRVRPQVHGSPGRLPGGGNALPRAGPFPVLVPGRAGRRAGPPERRPAGAGRRRFPDCRPEPDRPGHAAETAAGGKVPGALRAGPAGGLYLGVRRVLYGEGLPRRGAEGREHSGGGLRRTETRGLLPGKRPGPVYHRNDSRGGDAGERGMRKPAGNTYPPRCSR